jgi:hypothetical protein
MRYFLDGLESMELQLKLSIFYMVYSATLKKEPYVQLAFYFILFSPFSMWSGSGYANVGVFNNVLFYSYILVTLKNLRKPEWLPM